MRSCEHQSASVTGVRQRLARRPGGEGGQREGDTHIGGRHLVVDALEELCCWAVCAWRPRREGDGGRERRGADVAQELVDEGHGRRGTRSVRGAAGRALRRRWCGGERGVGRRGRVRWRTPRLRRWQARPGARWRAAGGALELSEGPTGASSCSARVGGGRLRPARELLATRGSPSACSASTLRPSCCACLSTQSTVSRPACWSRSCPRRARLSLLRLALRRPPAASACGGLHAGARYLELRGLYAAVRPSDALRKVEPAPRTLASVRAPSRSRSRSLPPPLLHGSAASPGSSMADARRSQAGRPPLRREPAVLAPLGLEPPVAPPSLPLLHSFRCRTWFRFFPLIELQGCLELRSCPVPAASIGCPRRRAGQPWRLALVGRWLPVFDRRGRRRAVQCLPLEPESRA